MDILILYIKVKLIGQFFFDQLCNRNVFILYIEYYLKRNHIDTRKVVWVIDSDHEYLGKIILFIIYHILLNSVFIMFY
jgi:hypothetical protein